jgi:hypothetical protein
MNIFPDISVSSGNSSASDTRVSNGLLKSSYETTYTPWWWNDRIVANVSADGSDTNIFHEEGGPAAELENETHVKAINKSKRQQGQKRQQQQQSTLLCYPSASRDTQPPRSHITHPAVPHIRGLCSNREQQRNTHLSIDTSGHNSSASADSSRKFKQSFTVFDAKRNMLVLRGTATDKHIADVRSPNNLGDNNNCIPTHDNVPSGRVGAVHVSFDLGFSWQAAGGREKWHYSHRVMVSEAARSSRLSYAQQHNHRYSSFSNSSFSSVAGGGNSSSSVSAQVLHGTYNCDSEAVRAFKDKVYAGYAAQWGLLRKFRAALVDANILYDEHRIYNQPPLHRVNNVTSLSSISPPRQRRGSQNVLRLLLVVITQAVDDSGWVEPIARGSEEYMICLLRRHLVELGWWSRIQSENIERLHQHSALCDYCEDDQTNGAELSNIRFMNIELLLD